VDLCPVFAVGWGGFGEVLEELTCLCEGTCLCGKLGIEEMTEFDVWDYESCVWGLVVCYDFV